MAYPLYAGVTASGPIFSPDSWKEIGIVIVGSDIGGNLSPNAALASYWVLLGITLTFSLKNFFTAYFFAVYENILAAENKNTVRRIVILFTDIIVYSIMFILLGVTNVNPVIPFLSMFIYGPLKGLMIYFYVKKKMSD
ncbi:hypothetical protein SCLARK_001791 [Spiroplasma clarkii]|uniref:hypothetical protein n=1 Tax=Spiroplasma clarkii TaxID=2139 RepID=UPI000B585965|nr:hypothetical protein [Spiroplasma clarkii]ARU92236.1 hypothetical protein SCLARK_001791 [Spiroplasma clarkii]